ncbi:MAG: hypothetical protein ABI383_14600 [Acidobacteriaceae bacterium]
MSRSAISTTALINLGELKFDYALSNSFGGTNGSLIFKRWTE